MNLSLPVHSKPALTITIKIFKLLKTKSTLLLLLFLIAFTYKSLCQDIIAQKPCENEFISHQADSIKIFFSKNGYDVAKETSITMESSYEMPIIVSLRKNTAYQFVFIGDVSSTLYEVTVYDWEEDQIFHEKKLAKDAEGNITNARIIPSKSEFHMIKVLQVNKKRKKDLCGYVAIFSPKKVSE